MAIVFMDSFDHYTSEELESKEIAMNRDFLYEIQDYIGEVVAGDLVVYAKDGDFSKLGEYKKDIWKVMKVWLESDNIFVNISNISKSSTDFKTYASNVIDIGVLEEYVDTLAEFVSVRSLTALDKLRGTSYSRETRKVNKQKEYEEQWTVEIQNKDKIKVNTTGEVTMMNRLINDNMNAAKTGAVLSAGNTLNLVVKDAIRGQVPRKYRKLLNTPMADIVVANVANVAVQNFAKGNYKAKVATNAMMEAAMLGFLNSFNLDQIITDTLKNVNIDDLIDTVD